jgi:hypothetical protein
MADQQLLANMYHAIQCGMVRAGRAPHYTELAAELGLSSEQAREALHGVFRAGVPGIWLYPNTDYVASFAPFSNLPTQYLVSSRASKWHGNRIESLAVSWFSHKQVRSTALSRLQRADTGAHARWRGP